MNPHDEFDSESALWEVRESITPQPALSGPIDLRTELIGSESEMQYCIQDIGLDDLPNDLTRMLYLASLRDCNSARYLLPELSSRLGVEIANRKLFACHDQVFRRLLATPISGYVNQLEEYIRYTRTEKPTVLRTWESLEAYRATVPVLALSVYRELFCSNIEAALMILGRLSSKDTK